MEPIAHLALTPVENSKLTPLEILADFADATRGWVYQERSSRHYAEQKGHPALVIRHWHDDIPVHVDFAFVAAADDSNRVGFVILDAPEKEQPLSRTQRARLIERLLEALQDYLSRRPDHVELHVERRGTGSAAS